ncbi:TolC family protein [Riemerella anatipestifer]|uniref:TolC family protein n=1 Tax=Riemerella anatipestifer TaxID=34085 RepID=UPI0030C2F5B4
MKLNLKNKILPAFVLLCSVSGYAQETLTLQKAIETAMQNNRGLQIKSLQKKEKLEKIKEDKIKKLPLVMVGSGYQYNVNIGQLTMDQGAFGYLPMNPVLTIPLPNSNLSFDLGKHHTFNAGAMFYQPLTQQFKINTGVKVSEIEAKITDAERQKISLQIEEAVQKLYYGLLINQKRNQEAQAHLEVEKIRLHDAESALLAGKTIALSTEALRASIADKEQELLKLEIEADDYRSDLKKLTLLPIENYTLDEAISWTPKNTAAPNPDEALAQLNIEKAQLAIKASKQSNLPDIGVVGGYVYQTGNQIIPTHNPFIGVNLKWNLQELFTNKSQEKQREIMVQQAQQNLLMTQDHLTSEIEKAKRAIIQFEKLMNVAQKAVNYRKGELKIQNDKKTAGLNTQIDLLSAEADLAKAQADWYAAALGYELAKSNLRRLTH